MVFDNVLGALDVLANGHAFLLMAVGVAAGLIAGAIPGFTIAMAVVLTLPFTFNMPPHLGLATMVSVLVGGLSGGLMAGILTGIPGTPSSVATTFDGFPMARNGEPGLALGIGVWSSFCGGIISAVLLMTMAPQLAQIGLEFNPWGYFMLVIFALTITASLAGKNMVKGLIAGALGLLVRTVGEDEAAGMARFDFGSDGLLGGFDFIAVLIGLFAFSQLLNDVRDPEKAKKSLTQQSNMQVRIEHRRAIAEILKRWQIVIRSSLIGVFTGILPGAGGPIAAFISYDYSKKLSKKGAAFGDGVPEGIAAPESANNAVTGGALIPMMTLGIPGDPVTAILIGALLVHGLAPGPLLFIEQGDFAYSIIFSFFWANIFNLFIALASLRLLVKVLALPRSLLMPSIALLCVVGAYALRNNFFDVYVMFFFGLLGLAMRWLDMPVVPLLLALVLGKPLEEHLRATLSSTQGDVMVFFTSPLSLLFLCMAVVSIIWSFAAEHRKRPKPST